MHPRTKTALQTLALVLTAVAVVASSANPAVWTAVTELAGTATLDDAQPGDVHQFTIATTAATDDAAAGVVSGNLNFVAVLTFTGTGNPEAVVTAGDQTEPVTLQSGSEVTSSLIYSVWPDGCREDQACSETVTVSVALTPPLGGMVALAWRAAVQAAGSSGDAPPEGFDVTIVEQ